MSKISKRETVILFAAAVAVLYGVYAFIPAKTTASASGSGPVSQVPDDLTANLGKDANGVDAYIVSLAETEWRSDPFSGRSYKTTGHKTAALGNKKTGFSYTCYMEMGGERVAVINDIDYRAGEPLEVRGYTLLSIHPSRVVIEERYSGVKFDVQLKEERPW